MGTEVAVATGWEAVDTEPKTIVVPVGEAPTWKTRVTAVGSTSFVIVIVTSPVELALRVVLVGVSTS